MAPTEMAWSDLSALPGAGEGLRELYEAYRRREALALLSLLPREAVRPLYRVARERSVPGDGASADDPVALLVDYVERELLPLPPFPVWLSDFQANRAAHLAGIDAAPVGADPLAPVAVEVRSLRHLGTDWYAALHLFRRDSIWWGFIRFTGAAELTEVRTADIFREEDPEAIRDRFRSFGPDALRAFLRSSLP
jgi:hypothetical protein